MIGEITSAVARVLVWSPGEWSGQSGALMMVPAPFHEQRHETVCLPVCSLPCEDAMRRPSLAQEECPHTLTARAASLDFQPLRLVRNKFLLLRPPSPC